MRKRRVFLTNGMREKLDTSSTRNLRGVTTGNSPNLLPFPELILFEPDPRDALLEIPFTLLHAAAILLGDGKLKVG